MILAGLALTTTLTVATAPSPVALAAPLCTGLSDGECAVQRERLHAELVAQHVHVVDVAALQPDCNGVPRCAGAAAKAAHASAIVQLEVLRVLGDVEANVRIWSEEGATLASSSRTVPVAALPTTSWLDIDARAALSALPPAPDAMSLGAPFDVGGVTEAIGPALGPAVVTIAGGAITVVGAIGFAAADLTLESASASGTAKAQAQSAGWVWLGVATFGLVTTGAGAAWWALQPGPST